MANFRHRNRCVEPGVGEDEVYKDVQSNIDDYNYFYSCRISSLITSAKKYNQ